MNTTQLCKHRDARVDRPMHLLCLIPSMVRSMVSIRLLMAVLLPISISCSSTLNSQDMYQCHSFTLIVKDDTGRSITNAVIVHEDSLMPYSTDFNGKVEVPCRGIRAKLPRYWVSAPGFKNAIIASPDNGEASMEIRLDHYRPTVTGNGNTIAASELLHSTQRKVEQLNNKAWKALSQKKYQDAESLLGEAFQLGPSSVLTMNNLGVVSWRQGKYDQAISWFERAAKGAPNDPDIAGNLGVIQWILHRKEESYTTIQRAMSLGYKSELGHYIIGLANFENNRMAEAVDSMKKVSANIFPMRDLYISIAFRMLGKTKAADAHYRSFGKRSRMQYITENPTK
jgi:hypothetical protein